MNCTIPVLAALTSLAVSPFASAQGVKSSDKPQIQLRLQTSPTSPFLLNRAPLFGSSPWSGAKPPGNVVPFSNHPFRSPGLFLWGQDRWSHAGQFNPYLLQRYPPFSWPGDYGYYSGPTDSDSNGVKSFIEQWGNRDPFAPKPSSGLSGSPLLAPGMTEEEVTRLLGSPVEKFSSGEIEIWRYSSFSLRFKDDKLEGLQ